MVLFWVISALQYLIPVAGVVFYFTDIPVGLYICAAYCFVFALQRIPKRDFGPIIGMILSLLFAIPMRSLFDSSYLPVAAMFICVEDVYQSVKTFIVLGKAMRQYKNMKIPYEDDDLFG